MCSTSPKKNEEEKQRQLTSRFAEHDLNQPEKVLPQKENLRPSNPDIYSVRETIT